MTHAQHADSSPGSAFLQFEGESDEEPDSRSFTVNFLPTRAANGSLFPLKRHK